MYDNQGFINALSNNHIEIANWLHNLDKTIIASLIDKDIPFHKLDIDPNTLSFITALKKNLPLPEIDIVLDDVVIHILFKKNRIADLNALALPYVSYDVVDNVVVNGTIKRLKAKSARNIN